MRLSLKQRKKNGSRRADRRRSVVTWKNNIPIAFEVSLGSVRERVSQLASPPSVTSTEMDTDCLDRRPSVRRKQPEKQEGCRSVASEDNESRIDGRWD